MSYTLLYSVQKGQKVSSLTAFPFLGNVSDQPVEAVFASRPAVTRSPSLFSFRQFGRRSFRARKCQTPLHPVFTASNALLYTIRSEKRPFVPYRMSVERCSTRSLTLRLFHPAVLRIFSGRGWSGSRRFGSVLWTDDRHELSLRSKPSYLA